MIKLNGVQQKFKNETAIRYADLQFESGKSYLLLGSSGCGKSTLLNLIAGILTPTAGKIEIDGRDMTALSQSEKDAFRIAKIGYVFQDFKLLEEMTVMDNLKILRMEGVDLEQAPAILTRLGIADQKHKKVRQLSGGQKQRLAIARAIIKQPSIILADEPTGNLNFRIGKQVMDELLAVSKGKTLLVVTHDERFADCFDAVVDMNAATGERIDLSGEEGSGC